MKNHLSSRLAIEYVAPSSLKPDPSNPRIHPPAQLRKLRRSFKRFGFIVPILVLGDDRLVAGHGCLQAALAEGLEQVPIIRLERLTAAEARAFALAHNRLAEDSSWDDRLVGEVLRALSLDTSIELEDTGFSIPEIDLKIEGLPSEADSADPADEVPELSESVPLVSVRGDLFKLGGHRVGCLDALDDASYQSLLAGKNAAIVLTDAPYNLHSSEIGGKGEIQHRDFLMAAGEMSRTQFIQFLTTVFRNLARYSANGSLHYLFMDWRHAYELLTAAYQNYTDYKALCVWAKTNGGMGSLYRSQHELVFVFKNGRGAHRNNVELGRHGRNRTNVWTCPGMNDFSRQGDEGNLLEVHPSVKPVRLLVDILLDASARGEVVLDAFLGSGSTLMAAERVGRVCYGMELDPRYVDTTVRRWQRYTGERAVHLMSGKTFDEIAAEKGALNG